MEKGNLAAQALEQGKGILRLAPNWVPRSFCVPGRRIKLHPDDYYVLGGERGGIDERWFSSTTPAKNGPLTGEHEGLSFIVFKKFLLVLKDIARMQEYFAKEINRFKLINFRGILFILLSTFRFQLSKIQNDLSFSVGIF